MKQIASKASPALGLAAIASLLIAFAVSAQATRPHINFEAESGTLSNQAFSTSDSSASGGAYLGFNAQLSGGSSFLETFDGTPTNPLPWNNIDWDVVQTVRNSTHWANPDTVDAHHAFHNCGDVASGGSHQVNTWPETVFKCNGHVMTSINGEPGYAAIYMSPPAMADFSSAPSTINFDVSTFISSARDWIDVTITPFADAMSYPFETGEVDGSGMPPNAISIGMEGINEWEIKLIRNGQTTTLGTLGIPYEGFGGMSRVTRTPLRIVVSSTSLTFSYPTVAGASLTVNFAALGWNQGIVQFGHHSYTPLKDCEFNPQLICEANTWHWDNIGINPARRFYQRQATPERTGAPIFDSNPRTLTFAESTPANAKLLFTGRCGVEVRDNSSAPWRRADVNGIITSAAEHVQSLSVSLPQGLSSIEFRFVANGGFGVNNGCQLANPIIKAPQ